MSLAVIRILVNSLYPIRFPIRIDRPSSSSISTKNTSGVVPSTCPLSSKIILIAESNGCISNLLWAAGWITAVRQPHDGGHPTARCYNLVKWPQEINFTAFWSGSRLLLIYLHPVAALFPAAKLFVRSDQFRHPLALLCIRVNPIVLLVVDTHTVIVAAQAFSRLYVSQKIAFELILSPQPSFNTMVSGWLFWGCVLF